MSDSKNNSGGIGFLGALLLLFIGLRLGDVIDWSWWWVMSPLWIPFTMILLTAAAFGIWWACTKERRK
jgi:hypothetical protein